MRERLRRALRWLLRRPHPTRPTETDIVQMGVYADGTPLLMPPQLFSSHPGPLTFEMIYRSMLAARASNVEIWGIDMKGGADLQPWYPGKSDLTEDLTDRLLELEARRDQPDD